MTIVRHIFRWDLDKTYLRSEFESMRDLVRTARTPAEQRQNIPGSAALIRAIRNAAPEGHKHLIYFLSGSPQQMRAVLERKFKLDGVAPDGFVLKPAVSEILRGRFRAIRGHIPFKLSQLLQGRADAPIGTAETLFGDDAESDAFIYSLYADVISGDVRMPELHKILHKAGAYPDQIREIEARLESIVRERPVRRIIIHLDQRTPPAAFEPYFPRVVPIYNHLQTAIVLYLDNTVGAEGIRDVCDELLARYGFDAQRLSNLAEDILRRRMRHSPRGLEQLARDLEGLLAEGPATDHRGDWAATSTVLEQIAERATHLNSRAFADEPVAKETERPDYLGLLDSEKRRRVEAKRARKQTEKAEVKADKAALKAAKKRKPSERGRSDGSSPPERRKSVTSERPAAASVEKTET